MIRVIFFIFILFSLTGCYVTSDMINEGVEKCKNNKGLSTVNINGEMTCNNGAVFQWGS